MPRGVARGSLLGITGQAWYLATAFALYIVFARVLGPAEFGRWRVVLSVLGWFEIVLATGLISVTSKMLAEDRDRAPNVVRAAYLGQGAASLVSFIALIASADLIAGLLSQPELAPLLRISALDIPLYGAFMVASSVLLGVHRFERQAVAWTAYATAKLVAIGGLVLLGWGVPGALAGNAIASLVGFGAAFIVMRGGSSKFIEVRALTEQMLLASTPFLALSLLKGFGDTVDLWFVSANVEDATLVGWYAAAVVLAEIPVFLMDGLNRVVFPSVSRAQAQRDGRLASRYTLQGMRLALMVTGLALAIIVGTGQQVLQLIYSDAYSGAYASLVILLIAAMGRVVRAVGMEALKARDMLKWAIGIIAITTTLHVVALAVLTPRFGLVGAAASTAGSMILGAVLCYLVLRDMLGVAPLVTFLRCLTAAAIVAAGLLWMAPRSPWFLATYPLAAIGYIAVLWLLREIGREDVEAVRAALTD